MAAEELKRLFAFLIAAYVSIAIGIRIASARNDAAIQLFSICQGTESAVASSMLCGTGLLLLLVVPGTIGVFLIVYTSIR